MILSAVSWTSWSSQTLDDCSIWSPCQHHSSRPPRTTCTPVHQHHQQWSRSEDHCCNQENISSSLQQQWVSWQYDMQGRWGRWETTQIICKTTPEIICLICMEDVAKQTLFFGDLIGINPSMSRTPGARKTMMKPQSSLSSPLSECNFSRWIRFNVS